MKASHESEVKEARGIRKTRDIASQQKEITLALFSQGDLPLYYISLGAVLS